jgi:hypothetical protein
MSNFTKDDLNEKALRRLLNGKQLAELYDLISHSIGLLFDAVSGDGCWKAEFTEEQRRVICQRIMVRMVNELFKPEPFPNSRPPTLH